MIYFFVFQMPVAVRKFKEESQNSILKTAKTYPMMLININYKK